MRKVSVACLAVALFSGVAFSQVVNICGTVTDDKGNPLTHSIVRLGVASYDNGFLNDAPYLVQTDQLGYYHLGTGICTDAVSHHELLKCEGYAHPSITGGKVLFSTPTNGSRVAMSFYDLSGRFVHEVMNTSMAQGNYSVSIDAHNLSSQLYILRVSINGATTALRLQLSSRFSGGSIVQNNSGLKTSVEKLAAETIVDTLHVTEPGYSLGVLPITSLTGKYDFTLTRVTTWDGSKAAFDAFWGDTSTYPKKGAGAKYIFLNRTNGKWPDSKVCWGNGRNNAKTPLSQTNITVFSGEVGVSIAPTDSNYRYYDFLEINGGPTGMWYGNTTRVDGWRLPIIFRIKTNDGKDTVMGDSYEMFFQSREAKFAEYMNEVPKEFTKLAMADFANIYSPNLIERKLPTLFNTGGPYVGYYDRYQDSVRAHNPGAPAKTTAWNVLACAGPLGGTHQYSGAYARHVGTMPQGTNFDNWMYKDTAYYYKDSPCNYFSKWCHRRAIDNLCYGFAYDDDGSHASYISIGNIQWFAIAIGW
jgi:hypothetical protein